MHQLLQLVGNLTRFARATRMIQLDLSDIEAYQEAVYYKWTRSFSPCVLLHEVPSIYYKTYYGHETIVLINYYTLTFLQQSRLRSGRTTRWTFDLHEYQLKIKYFIGKYNIGADIISRYFQYGMVKNNKTLAIAANTIKKKSYSLLI